MQKDNLVLKVVASALAVAGLALSGCSTGSSSTAISPNVATTATQTLITDAPADQVLALSLKVDSIVLTDAAGATASILNAPVPIEVSHLDAVQEPLLPPLAIPQDTYVSATITVEAPIVVYVDSTSKKPVKVNATLAASTDTITFTNPITVGTTAAPICFDLLVGQSVAFATSGTTTTVTVTPTFNITQITLPTASATPTNANNGKVSGVQGQVVSTSGVDLVIQGPNAQQLTLVTNTATQLQGFTALSTLTAGELVDADVAQQPDGSLLALRVHLDPLPLAANLLVGPVTAVTGSPATSFTQLVRQPVGPAVTPAATTASTYTVTVNGSTVFSLAPQAVAQQGGAMPTTLPFTPTFTAATMFAGQNVAVGTSAISTTADTATAATVTLAPQTIDGTVASVGVAPGGMQIVTVTLPAQSALASLTGATSVVVYTNGNTQLMNATAALPVVGSNIRFNGLLFNNGGTLSLMAGGCNDFPPGPPVQVRH
jgi:hypothetical protein